MIAGLPAMLKCAPPFSVPMATVTWYKDNALLVPRTGGSVFTSFVLSIFKVSLRLQLFLETAVIGVTLICLWYTQALKICPLTLSHIATETHGDGSTIKSVSLPPTDKL